MLMEKMTSEHRKSNSISLNSLQSRTIIEDQTVSINRPDDFQIPLQNSGPAPQMNGFQGMPNMPGMPNMMNMGGMNQGKNLSQIVQKLTS